MKYKIINFLNAATYLLLFVLLALLVSGNLPLAVGSVGIGAVGVVFTCFRRNELFVNFASPLHQLQLRIHIILGTILSLTGWFASGMSLVGLGAALQLAFWIWFYCEHQVNKEKFTTILFTKSGGRPGGLMLKDVWVNPPIQAIKPLDTVVTGSWFSLRIGVSVDHGEFVVLDPNGERWCLSSHWTKGIVLTPLEKVLKGSLKTAPYFVMRPREPLTSEQVKRSWDVALEMKAANAAWREREEKRIRILVDTLPLLPSTWKNSLFERIKPDGYDWTGLISGRRRKHRWTCIAACVEAYYRLGIKLERRYGVGAAGLIGLGDPINPILIWTDAAFRHLDKDDEKALTAATLTNFASNSGDPNV